MGPQWICKLPFWSRFWLMVSTLRHMWAPTWFQWRFGVPLAVPRCPQVATILWLASKSRSIWVSQGAPK